MKLFLISALLFSFSSFSQEEIVRIDKVRSIEYEDDEATITFWGMNQVYRIPASDKVIPCIDNGLKSKMDVALKMNKEGNAIEDCRLYNGGIPNY